LLTDAGLRAYLLGQTTEANAERVEIRALDDEDFFETIKSVEDDLFDEYARGSMTDDERSLFLAKYGADRDRLRVAHALAGRTAPPRAVWWRAAPPYWMAAVAAVLLAAVGFPLLIKSRSTLQDRSTPSVSVSTPAAVRPAPVALLLTLGSSRSAASSTETRLPPFAATLQLRVRLDPADTFDSYAMELRSDRGVAVWRADALHASAADGDLIVAGDVPAASLQSASYELTVLGSPAGGAPEALGFAAVKIAR
jgi:hypothetical protein